MDKAYVGNVTLLKDRRPAPVENAGEPPHDGGMEPRVARLESDVGHIKSDVADLKTEARLHREALSKFGTEVNAEFRAIRKDMSMDFRLLFGALIAVALGLAGLLAKGFEWL